MCVCVCMCVCVYVCMIDLCGKREMKNKQITRMTVIKQTITNVNRYQNDQNTSTILWSLSWMCIEDGVPHHGKKKTLVKVHVGAPHPDLDSFCRPPLPNPDSLLFTVAPSQLM